MHFAAPETLIESARRETVMWLCKFTEWLHDKTASISVSLANR